MTSLAERAAQMSPQAREVLARELIRAGTVFPLDALAEPVAVVGIGCRFPGNVTGPESLWRLLLDGEDAIVEVPADRWDADAFYDPDPATPGRMTTKWGGFVSDVAGFDADFFGITPREAEAMDPQQRMLLEVAWESLEHAGIAPDSLSGSRTGVIVGMSSWDYTIVNIEHRAEIDAYLSTGNPHSAAVGRIAYLLGLRGPAVAVDTACSSSLVAIHLACQSLRLRESDLVLAGGVQLSLSPFTGIALSKWSALSPQGRCKAFDAGADGFVRGEGCGVVVLKRLADAQRDGDRVLAVVRGSAINQDGRSNGMTAPNAMAQRDVITDALRAGDIAADTVHYVETHGTGTVLGDPIEFEGLTATYGDGQSPCALGAIKTNLGHLEAAAGVAGFIKAVMVVGHQTIPSNRHFTRWNPAIDPSSTRFYVPTENTSWPADGGMRRAGVSSFGLGGTNAHVVLEQAPEPAPTASAQPVVSTLVVSGKTPQRLSAWAAALADWMDGAGASTPLPDVAHTLRHHRALHATVGTVAAADRGQAVTGLRALAAGRPAPGVVLPHEGPSGRGTVFVYSGQGSQWAGMGRQLMTDEPAFASAVADMDSVFVEQTGFSLQAVLAGGEPVSGIDRIQPVLVGVQLALTALWRAHGVEPDAVIGHSMGEITAAVVAGALTVADGLRVIATRSRLMARLAGQGAMALLELDAGGAEALIADYPQVTVAVHASPRQTVIAGPPEQIDTLIAVVEHTGRLARRVDVDVASHNPIIEAILPELRTAISDLVPTIPTIPIITTTYDKTGPAATFDADYWVANLRNPVRFAEAVASAATHHATFIEMSPHPLLTHAITETLESAAPARRARVTSAMNRDDDQTLFFNSQLTAIMPSGGATEGRIVDVPHAPWQHIPFWVADRSGLGELSSSHPLLGAHMELPSGRDHVWQADVGIDVCPWLADHKVHGQPILPAAAFAEIALAAGSEALGLPAHAVSVMRLEVEQMLPLDGHTRITTQLSGNADGSARVEIHSRSGSGWSRHAVAKIDSVQPNSPAAATSASVKAGGTEVSAADFYATLRQTGQHHGPAFAALTRIIRHSDGGSDTEITLPQEAVRHPGFRVHPVMLDAALQTMAAAMPDRTVAQAAEISYLPVSFETIRVFREVGRHARCHADVVDLDEAGAGKLGTVTLTDDADNVVAELTGVYVRRVERRAIPLPLEQKIFETAWVESPAADGAAAMPGSWLLLADSRTAASANEFADLWGSELRRVITADLADESQARAAFAETGADPERPPAGVVLFIPAGPTDIADAVNRSRDLIWSVASTVRTIVGGWHGRPPRLWLVTRSGLAVNGDGPGDPAAAALRGLIRVLAYEHSDLRATLVDLDDAPSALGTELGSATPDDVIAWRAGRRFVERLVRAELGSSQREPVRDGAAYIVTGGLGGLGMVVTRWLVDNGAGRVVLNGRSEPSEEQRKILADMEAAAEITFIAGDIASPAVAEQLVAAAEETGRQLRGIVHGAAVIDDGLVIAMSKESLERVWAPKAVGAVRLHEASATRKLDWWAGFSSVASLLGSPGQGAYAAASAWLDGLMTWRASSGLPATGINWGPWSEVGVAQSLTGSVLDPITPTEGIEALATLLGTDRCVTGVARLRADRALAAFPEIRGLGYFSRVVEELDATDADGGDWAGVDSLRGVEPGEAKRIITDRLCVRMAAVMGYADPAAVVTTQPLTEMGLDSLMAVRIRNTARADFGVEPPVALLLQGATLGDVAADLIGQLGLAEPSAGEPDRVRDRAQQRAAARQEAALRRKRGQRV